MDQQAALMTELRSELEEANQKSEENDAEMRKQIDTAMRKLTNYKDELAQKKTQNAKLEESIDRLKGELESAKLAAASSTPKIEDSLQSNHNESFKELRAEN